MTVAALTQFRSWLRLPGFIDNEFALGAGGGLILLGGLLFSQPALVGAGAVGVCLVCRNVLKSRGLTASPAPDTPVRKPRGGGLAALHRRGSPGVDPENEAPPEPAPARPRQGKEGDLVDQMIRARRYALLLRSETAGQLTQDQHVRAIRELDEAMVLVPAGSVLVGVAAERETLGHDATSGLLDSGGDSIVRVAPCYIDRYTVTNEDYQHFVDAGGYEELELWPEEALPALFDFVDETGEYAPKFWRKGRFLPGTERLPVVGVSWYEAVAYARWVGKRLPDDAEWTKAGAWPVEAAPGRIAQRRYPWGESFDNRRANIWSSGHGKAVAVDEYPEGATVGGVEQMVGNVWEWTSATLDETTPHSVRFPSALRTVRGGAFNTYFENQATCHFQSAEHPLARRANIGVRLAIGMDALASAAAGA